MDIQDTELKKKTLKSNVICKHSARISIIFTFLSAKTLNEKQNWMQTQRLAISRTLDELTKDSLIVDVLDAEPEACWESADQDVQVKEEGDPGGGLVLWHGRDDGDVDLCVSEHNKGKGRLC